MDDPPPLSPMPMSNSDKQVGLWARLSVRHTKKTCFIAVLVPIAALIIVIAGNLFNLNPNGGNDFNIPGDLRSQLEDARSTARKDYPYIKGNTGKPAPRLRQAAPIIVFLRPTSRGSGKAAKDATIDVSKPGRNMLTAESMAFLKAAEDKFMQTDGYKKYCWANPADRDCLGKARDCALPESITNHPSLYGITLNESVTLCGRRTGSDPVPPAKFAEFLTSLVNNSEVNPLFSIFLGTDFTATNRETQIVRSFIQTGSPAENEKDFDKWAQEASHDLSALSTSTFHIFAFGDYSFGAFDNIVMRDLSFAGISVILVFIVIWAHTTSGLLAVTALAQILLAFPFTYFAYRAIFQIKYFAALQVMTIFLILGIGADDVFVFTDAWKQSAVALGADSSLEVRMQWTYRRAVKAMAVTSITTAAAFYSTAASPIMPISTLGVWAGTLVLLQFALVITMFPSAIIMWHRFWRVRSIRNCFRAPAGGELSFADGGPGPAAPGAAHFAMEEGAGGNSPSEWVVSRSGTRLSAETAEVDGVTRASGDIPHVDDSSGFITQHGASIDRLSVEHGTERKKCCGLIRGGKRDENKYRPIERFFNGPWTKLLDVIKFPLIVVGLALMGASIYCATRLAPPVEQENLLPDSNPVVRGFNLMASAFPVRDGDLKVPVKIIWGLQGIDRSGISKYDPDTLGKPVLDLTFNLSSAAAQQRILDACTFIETEKRALLANEPTIDPVSCWIKDFKEWRGGQFVDYPNDLEIASELLRFGVHVDSRGSKPYLHYLTSQRIAFKSDLSRVVFTELFFVSRTKFASSYTTMIPEYELWVAALEEFNQGTTLEAVNKPFVVGGEAWKWMMSQKALVDNMFLGIGIVLAVALVALTVSTGNWIVSILALMSIAGILTNILALLYILGWTLGVTESIGVVIAVGFSFDFVAHVANAYVETEEDNRKERTRAALRDLGISILAGALSTLLAGSMLFFATIIFFVKFGMFVFSTIALSLIWSLTFFPCLLLVVGPTGATGQLSQIFRGIKGCLGLGKRRSRNPGVIVLDE